MKIDLYSDGIGFVEYDQHMGDDVTIVNAARVSFGKKKDTLDVRDQRLIRYLIKHKHTSTLEHNVVTFRIKVPLFVARQHHRHRTWSYNEISRRYTDVDICFYEPAAYRTQHKSNRQASNVDELINPEIEFDKTTVTQKVNMHHRRSLRLYDEMVLAGVCREQARGVLPQNMYTEYMATVNLNNLIKFINLRTHEGAQKEIVDLAHGMIEICKEFWPNIFNIYEEFKNENIEVKT
jgi:thymidylate synthase (FAD)